MKLGAVTQVTTPAVSPADEAQEAQKAKVHKVATEFESLLLKQILEGAKVCGKKEDAYTGMALTGLADSLATAGGMGLAKQLEEALSPRPRILPQVSPPASVTGSEVHDAHS